MKRSIWILGDQLGPSNAALASASPRTDTIVMIEGRDWAAHENYHRQRRALVLTAMRHRAAELARAGWTVDYYPLAKAKTTAAALAAHAKQFAPDEILLAEPNNHWESTALRELARALPIRPVPTRQFLVGRDDFRAWAGTRKHLLMESHYRRMRVELDILVDADGQPEGGRWNFDSENRKGVVAWRDRPRPAPSPPSLPADRVADEVFLDIERFFPDAPGRGSRLWLPASRTSALEWLEHFVKERLPGFGDFQDLMLEGEPTLFHALLSPAMNIGLLEPRECVDAALREYRAGRAPLAAVEGFVRQIIGWREFVNGVYWLKMPAYSESNALDARRALPAFFYTGETDMNCLSNVLAETLDRGFNHHIQRLMVLGNFLLLAGVRPQEALRWFNEMYVDAHDWVMAANLLGMALHADGGFMSTKPYAAGAGYISKMSDYCAGCRFNPAAKSGPGACPFNLLYWAFYERHQDRFVRNPRTAMMVRSWRKRPESTRRTIVAEADAFLESIP